MKLSELFSAFQRQPAAEGGAGTGHAAGRLARSDPNAQPAMERLPDPPPLSAEEDIVDVSREATFVLAASRYDPHRITPRELTELATLLRDGGAIGAADYSLLLRGPSGGDQDGNAPDQPRDVIADWQESLADSMGRPDLRAIGAGTRALNVLGRVAAAREQV